MILEIDAGNTRIKWRCLSVSADQPGASGVAEDERELIAQFSGESGLTAIRLSCVRGPDAIEQISEWARTSLGITVQVAKVTRECAGVSNYYSDMSRMGVDRWLAMLAAFNRARGACVIVDAGTAMTVDAISAEGAHLGGYILPGRQLQAKVLQDNTRIRLKTEPGPAIDFGHDTEAAVVNGIYASQVALIEKVLNSCSKKSDNLKLYLAGGDALTLSELLAHSDAFEVETVSDLVLDGLRLACNEDGD